MRNAYIHNRFHNLNIELRNLIRECGGEDDTVVIVDKYAMYQIQKMLSMVTFAMPNSSASLLSFEYMGTT